MDVDVIDKKILSLLQDDAKIKMKNIAEELGMTITPVYERIKKMEREGLIQNYTVNVDLSKLGFKMHAYCSVTLKEHSKQNLERFEKQIQELKQVIECNHMSGDFDYLLKIVVRDMEAYQAFISQQLAALENIGQVHSYFVMKQVKQTKFEIS